MDTPDHEAPKEKDPAEIVPIDRPKSLKRPPPTLGSVYQRVARVAAAMERLAKEGQNQAQGYKFVRVEDVVDTLRPLLAENGLFLQWHTAGYELLETKTAKGYPAWLCKLVTTLTIYTDTGEMLTCGQTFAMAIDSGDKAVTKAETSARKYSLIKAFNLSTGDDLEDDAGDKEPGGKKPAPKPRAGQQQRLIPGQDRKLGIARLMVTLNKLAKHDLARAHRLLDDDARHNFLDETFGVRSLNDLDDTQFAHLLASVEGALKQYE